MTIATLGGRGGAVVRAVLILATVGFSVYLLQSAGRALDPAVGVLETTDPWWRIAHVVAGVVLLGSGVTALTVSSLSRTGVLAVLAAVTWFGPDLARFAIGPLPVRAAGVACAVLFVPLSLHMLTAAPVRHATDLVDRRILAAVTILAVAAAVAVMFSYAPLHDIRCAEACNFPTAMLPVSQAQRNIVRDAAGLVTVLSGGLLAFTGARALARDRAVRGWLRSLLGGGLLAGIAGACVGLLWVEPSLGSAGSASVDPAWIVLPLLSTGVAIMAAGLAWLALDLAAAPRRIRRVADDLALHSPDRSLEAALGVALGDPGLRLGYPTDVGQTLGADGSDIELSPAPGQTVTTLTRAGIGIALVRHRADVDDDVLWRAFRPSLLLALDNERLRALRLSTLRELQASRARIVELGDAERRRIERDLHDGAQQRLLAIAFDLRLAHAAAERQSRHDGAVLLANTVTDALALVEELRRLCRGIHPQVLSQAGLPAALAALADDSEIPVEVSVALEARPPLAIETAAYELVVDALGQGMVRGASALTVRVSREADEIVVAASDGGVDEPEVRSRLADRIGALGGAVSAGVSAQGGYLRAVLPCA